MTLPKYLSVAALIAVSLCGVLGNVVVKTKAGSVRGIQHQSEVQGIPFYSFRGIPYAEPPVGNLRFEPPVAKKSWAGEWDATKDADHCIQDANPARGSEDCLFVNVYTPVKPTGSCSKLLPTMVWLYGGGFEGGESNYELYGPDHLLEQGTVVVTLNYRLGIWGFLSTEDLVVPGNNGLKDQLLALKWVRDNIKNFCGDPNQVTLAGQSAGSAAVAYHVQSPQSKGLFHRAIMQSGTSLTLWGLARRVRQITNMIGTEFGIDTTDSQTLVNGLRVIEAYELQNISKTVATSAFLSFNPREGFMFGPVSEVPHAGAFFTGKSHQQVSSGQFNRVPILIGFNSLEGSYSFELAFRLFLAQYDKTPTKMLPIDLNLDVTTDRAQEAAIKIKEHFFGWVPVALSNMELMTWLSQDQFSRGIREFARQAKQYVPVYMYRFSYQGGLWGLHNRTVDGVTHSEELGYYWRSPHEPKSSHDLVIRERMVSLWSNFIKEGNPTPKVTQTLQNVVWKKVDDKITYLDIGENLVLSEFPEKADMEFWDQIYATYGQPPYDTY